MNTTQTNLLVLRRAGLSQAQIAELLDVSQALVSRWEAGNVPPAVETAQRIAELAKEKAAA